MTLATTVTTATGGPGTTDADALVLLSRPMRSTDDSAAPGVHLLGADQLPAEAVTQVTQALVTLRASGRADEVVALTAVAGLPQPLVAVSGLGGEPLDGPLGTDDSAWDGVSAESVRAAVGAAVRTLSGRAEVALALPEGTPSELVTAAAEGALFGAYEFTHHRGKSAADSQTEQNGRHRGPVRRVQILGVAEDDDLAASLDAASVLAEEQAWARDLVNTGANELYPASFAEQVQDRAADGVEVEVMDEQQLAEAGCGGILGVGQGSARPPRIVVMRYAPTDAAATLAYVGKGITFDSGGLCIKPANSMITMKCDMAGAAAVAAAVNACARLELPVAVTGYLCLAENMTGPNAQRPGDVVTMRDGTTVEIINTDAEGRLVMADGLALASEVGPDAIVDIATLTGAAIVALGKRTAAVLANDDAFQGELTSAATAAGEAVWPMPITPEMRSGLDSTVADLKHTGEPGSGGTMAAAAFLREFVGEGSEGEQIPWGHLDIAGPAFNEGGATGYTPKGGTGFGVRTLVELARARG